MLGEQMLRMIVGLLVGLWVARYLGPEQFGVYSYVIAFTSIFGSIAKLGLDSIVVRELVNQPEKQNLILGTVFWLKIAGALLAMALIAIVLPWTSDDKTTSHYIFVIASGLIFQSFEVIDFYFQSQVLAKFVSICKVVILMLSSLIKIYLMVTGAKLFWFFFVALLDQVILALLFSVAYCFKKKNIHFLREVNLSFAKLLLHDSWPLIISSLVVVTHMCIDKVVINEMLGERDVGLYSAAARLSEVWYFVPVITTFSLFPAIVNAKKQSDEYYYAMLQRLYTFMVWIGIGIAVPVALLSDWLVALLYGESYRDAGRVLAIHVWGVIFIFHVSIRSSSLLVENKQKYVTVFAVFTLITHLLLNFFLIDLMGIIGAAYASLGSWFLCACLFPLFSNDTQRCVFMFYKSFVPSQST